MFSAFPGSLAGSKRGFCTVDHPPGTPKTGVRPGWKRAMAGWHHPELLPAKPSQSLHADARSHDVGFGGQESGMELMGCAFRTYSQEQPQLLTLGQIDHDHGGQNEANGVGSSK
jgi:hypothetical protein